jgi:phosphonate transport system substrate-binding protein
MLHNRKLLITLVVLAAAVFALAGCGTGAATATEAATPEATAEVTEAPTAEPTEEGPALGTADNPLIISFVPSADAATVLASATAITDKLSELSGLTITAEVPTSYVASIEAMCSGEAAGGALNTFSYVVAHERGCADVALVAVRNDLPTYTGQIVTRPDTGITSVADLKGHTFCRPDEFSTSGWIIPSILMRKEGIDPEKDITVKDTGGHDGVIRAVYNGECDAGSSFGDARTLVASELTDVNDKVIVIATTDPIPNDTVAFSPDVPADVSGKVVDAFLAMVDDPDSLKMLGDLYRWTGLQKVDDSFYDPFRQLLEAAGVSVDDFVK